MGPNYLTHLYANFLNNYLYTILNSWFWEFWEFMDAADQLYAITYDTFYRMNLNIYRFWYQGRSRNQSSGDTEGNLNLGRNVKKYTQILDCVGVSIPNPPIIQGSTVINNSI